MVVLSSNEVQFEMSLRYSGSEWLGCSGEFGGGVFSGVCRGKGVNRVRLRSRQ